MQFKAIPDHAETKENLVSAFENHRIGHALLFNGEDGSASMAIAIAFAQYFNCADKTENDSCGRCSSCVKIEKNIHPDVHFYFPNAKTKKISKKNQSSDFYEEWRSYLNEELFPRLSDWKSAIDAADKDAIIPKADGEQIIKDLGLKSYESEYRFVIIWLPEKMNITSSNMLLKLIEEPPDKVLFFLVTENLEAILPTIRSRTQLIRIGRMDNSALEEWLRSTYPRMKEDEYTLAVREAEGNPSRARRSLNHELTDMDLTEFFIKWARLCYEARLKLPELIDWSNEMARRKKEDHYKFLKYGMEFFRSGLLNNFNAEDLSHNSEEEARHVKNFAKLLNAENGFQIIEAFDKSVGNLNRSANSKLIFLNLSIKFGNLINPKNVNL